MTVQELKIHLDKFPADSTVYFQLWEQDGPVSIVPNTQHPDPIVREGKDGEFFSMVLYADRCLAQTLYHPIDKGTKEVDYSKLVRYYQR